MLPRSCFSTSHKFQCRYAAESWKGYLPLPLRTGRRKPSSSERSTMRYTVGGKAPSLAVPLPFWEPHLQQISAAKEDVSKSSLPSFQKKHLLKIIDLLIFEIQGSWILVKPWKFLRLLPLRPMFDSGSLSNLLRPRLSPWFPSQHPMGPTDNAKWLGATVASNSASP